MSDYGNRGERVKGVRYSRTSPIEDQLVFDRLPLKLRRYLIQAPFRLNAAECLQAIEDGYSVTQVITRCELSCRAFIEAAEEQRQAGDRA